MNCGIAMSLRLTNRTPESHSEIQPSIKREKSHHTSLSGRGCKEEFVTRQPPELSYPWSCFGHVGRLRKLTAMHVRHAFNSIIFQLVETKRTKGNQEEMGVQQSNAITRCEK
jgi:hypothetical protein